jgi:hypothetical protein
VAAPAISIAWNLNRSAADFWPARSCVSQCTGTPRLSSGSAAT